MITLSADGIIRVPACLWKTRLGRHYYGASCAPRLGSLVGTLEPKEPQGQPFIFWRCQPMKHCIADSPVEGCIDSCQRSIMLIEDLAANDYFVGRKDSPLGEHLRHCLDHFDCFLKGLQGGSVDYDARQPKPELSADPKRLCLRFREVIAALRKLDPQCFGQSVEVRSSACKGSGPVKLQSTISRELVFLSSHTIHHLEIARLVAEIDGFKTKPDLALAFSTEARLQAERPSLNDSQCAH